MSFVCVCIPLSWPGLNLVNAPYGPVSASPHTADLDTPGTTSLNVALSADAKISPSFVGDCSGLCARPMDAAIATAAAAPNFIEDFLILCSSRRRYEPLDVSHRRGSSGSAAPLADQATLAP